MASYLDKIGVQYLWKKIKEYIDSHSSGGVVSNTLNIGENFSGYTDGNALAVSTEPLYLYVPTISAFLAYGDRSTKFVKSLHKL